MTEEVKNKKCSDLRTFWIAFVTAVMVVALYHLGTGLCRIYFPECNLQAPCAEMPPPCAGMAAPQQLFILVPVGGFEGGRGNMCPLRRCGEFRRDRGRHEKGAMHGRFNKGHREGKADMKGPHPQKFGPKAPKGPAPEPAPMPAPEEK